MPCYSAAMLPNIPADVASAERLALVARAFRLEWLTIGWLSIEAAAGIGAGLAAGSVTLLAFGADGVIELASAAVLIWRLKTEIERGEAFSEAVERRAARIAGGLLFALVAYLVASAGWSLATRSGQQLSPLGFAVTSAALPVMILLSRAKSGIADRIGSRALRADAVESMACAYLSAVVLTGLVAQWLFDAWWIDGITALALVPLLVREGWEAWRGEDD
jgi:divalent metal cation (Fe/Co/Zn/Cd) transporter